MAKKNASNHGFEAGRKACGCAGALTCFCSVG
jgi:hypothetical protein